MDAAASIIETYNAFVTRITELGLDKSVDSKPILDVRLPPLPHFTLLANYLFIITSEQGHSVCEVVGASKPGRWTGCVLSKVMEWQLDHPGGTKEMCAEWLKEEFKAGRIVVEDAKTSSGAKRR